MTTQLQSITSTSIYAVEGSMVNHKIVAMFQAVDYVELYYCLSLR